MVAPSENSCSTEALRDSLISIAVEQWRFSKVFNRMLTKLDAGEQRRYTSQFSWFTRKVSDALQQAGLKIVNIEGEIFTPGTAATPMNIDEFEPEEELYIDSMLEPVIMGPSGLVRRGTVTLRKVEQK